VALTAIAAIVIFVLKIGAVVATITPEHGVHAGDPIGMMALLAALAVLSPLPKTYAG